MHYAFSITILRSSCLTLTKSPFPIPKLRAYSFGRIMEKEVSPIKPCTFLYSILDSITIESKMTKINMEFEQYIVSKSDD